MSTATATVLSAGMSTILSVSPTTLHIFPRFPPYVYQLDISTHVVIMLTFLGLGFIVSFYEEAIKKAPWILYVFSVLTVVIIEVRIT